MYYMNPEFMWWYFSHEKLACNLRTGAILNLPKIYSIYYNTIAATLGEL